MLLNQVLSGTTQRIVGVQKGTKAERSDANLTNT